MASWDWQGLLKQMNDGILSKPIVDEFSLPSEVIESGWIGYDPATEEQIAVAEARLGVTLPPSYRAFLKTSNGWRVCNPWMEAVYPVENIDFTRNTDLDLIEIWAHSGTGAASASLSDIAHTIRISAWTDMAVLLLNPQKSTTEGEWEAWFYSDTIQGAEVFPSFWDLMQDQLNGLIAAVEGYVPSPPPPPKKDQREVVVIAIQHIRQAWLSAPEYDVIQAEIDAIIARIRALPAANQEVFQTGLRQILIELKNDDSKSTAQALLLDLINNDVSTTTISFIRRQSYLFVATVIESYV